MGEKGEGRFVGMEEIEDLVNLSRVRLVEYWLNVSIPLVRLLVDS